MKVYTVLSPSAGDAAYVDPMAVVTIKEGFSWPAFFFPVLWLLFQRLWLVLIGYVVALVALGTLGEIVGGALPGLAVAGLHVLFALEANELRRSSLLRRGYTLAGVVTADSLEEAEIRYFARPEPEPPPDEPSSIERALPPTPVRPAPAGDGAQVVGLFPPPGGAAR